MGAELLLTYKGKDVAGLGVSDGYYSDILKNLKDNDSACDKVYAEFDLQRERFIKNMFVNIIALKPSNIEEVKDAIDECMAEYEEHCFRAGRTFAVINCIDEYGKLDLEESI